MSTVCKFISEISENECVGQSLNKINNNYLNTRNVICTVDNRLNNVNRRLQTLTTTVCSISSAQLAKAWVSFDGKRGQNGAVDTNTTLFSVPSSRFIRNSYNIIDVKKNGIGDYNIQIPLSTIQTSSNNTTISNTITGLVVGGSAAPSTLNLNRYSVCIITTPKHPISPFPAPNTFRIQTVDLSGNLVDSDNISLTIFN